MEGLNYTPWISGAAQPKLTQDRIMNIAIAVPPRSEQDEVIGRVKAQTAPIHAAITRARRQIELLREYRTRLIADVVTGKLDVRETTANLPDETGRVRPIELDNNNENATKCNRMLHFKRFLPLLHPPSGPTSEGADEWG